MRLTLEEWETAKAVCTPKQLQALDIWNRRHFGYMKLGQVLGVPRDTAKGRVERGLERMRAGLELRA